MKSSLSWLTPLLNDLKVTDICINGEQSIFIERGHRLEPVILPASTYTNHDLKTWILEQFSLIGKTWDAKHPFVDAALPSGHRIHVAFPPLSPQGVTISLRRLPQRLSHLEKKKWGDPGFHWNDSPLYLHLAQAIQAGDSILISGATGSGKTTLANDLLAEIPEHERIIALEDTPELTPSHPHFLSLLSRPANADGFGEVTLRQLLKQTLRMRPDRMILGECRGSEVLDLLQALNTGHRGALATLHANSPRDALRRIELLCILAAEGKIPIPAIRELLSLGIQWITQVQRIHGIRKISALYRVESREGDTILLRSVLESESYEHESDSHSTDRL